MTVNRKVHPGATITARLRGSSLVASVFFIVLLQMSAPALAEDLPDPGSNSEGIFSQIYDAATNFLGLTGATISSTQNVASDIADSAESLNETMSSSSTLGSLFENQDPNKLKLSGTGELVGFVGDLTSAVDMATAFSESMEQEGLAGFMAQATVQVVNYGVTTVTTKAGQIVGGAIGGAAGTALGPEGTVSGQIVGQAVGGVAGNYVGSQAVDYVFKDQGWYGTLVTFWGGTNPYDKLVATASEWNKPKPYPKPIQVASADPNAGNLFQAKTNSSFNQIVATANNNITPPPTGITFNTSLISGLLINFHINNTDAAVRTALGVFGAVTFIITGPGFTSGVISQQSLLFNGDPRPNNYVVNSFISLIDSTNFDIPRSGVSVNVNFLGVLTPPPSGLLPPGDYGVAVSIPVVADGSNIQVAFEVQDTNLNFSGTTFVESIDGVSSGTSSFTATYDGANTIIFNVVTP